MPEPTSVAAVVGTAAASPVLVLLGLRLGLQPSDLIAGAAGASLSMLFYNAVPSTGDGARELARTTFKRMAFALGSAVFAAFGAPVAGPVVSALLGILIPAEKLAPLAAPLQTFAALILGGGAQRFFSALIERGVRKVEGKTEGGA